VIVFPRIIKIGLPQSLVFFILFLLVNTHLNARSLPLWELGIATGYASLPYYRGSASSRKFLVPLPLAIYREKKPGFASNVKSRLYPRLLASDKLTLGMSAGGMLPVPEGGTSGVRRGMPGLGATLELGPRLAMNLWEKAGQSFSLHLPLRAMLSLSPREIDAQGWVFAPYLYYSVKNFNPENYRLKKGANNGWQLNIAAGPQYGSRDFHAYYYAVNNQYANNGRTAYIATAGYSGSRVSVYAQKTINRLWLSVFARYDDLSGASFINSPLVEQEHALFGGFVVGWVFARSY